MSQRHLSGGDAYLKLYPRETERWMNTCATCGRRGYKPELPEAITTRLGREEIETALATHLRNSFTPLALNDDGICDQCAELLPAKN